jgi:hypothetical protein
MRILFERSRKMKLSIILATACVFLFLSSDPAKSDEVSDLSKKVEILQQTIDELKAQVKELKKKQEVQAEEVEKVSELAESVEELQELPSQVAAELGEGVTIGGHFKAYILDRTDGERNNRDQNNNLSAGIHDLYLYFGKTLSDWLSLDVAPKISVLAGATPALGADITRATSASVDIDLDEAYMTMRLPYYELETRVGAFYPFFSEEYARQTWWHEQYHGNNGLLTLQSWRSNGVEIYRNFDFEEFSLPVYLYWLNGDNTDSRFVDNNGNKNLLLHVAPEFFAGRLKLLGSFGYGEWDDNDDYGSLQYALGADMKSQKFSILGEYLYRGLDGVPLTAGGRADGNNEGYFIRVMYTFNPKWRALVKYSDVDLYSVSTTMLTDNYKTTSFAVNYWITDGSTIIPQLEYVDADRSNGSESLEYLRWTLGWRTTF